MMPVLRDVSVVIPTLGRDLLAGCLQSIANGSTWPAHLIVVDQSSSKRVAALVEKLRSVGMQAEHVPSNQSGVAAGRNRGIERVLTPFFVVTDDDCLVAPGWLERMSTCLRENPQGIVTGRVEPGGAGVVVSIKTSLVPAVFSRPRLSGEVLFPNNMGCAKSVFQRVGNFDEHDFVRFAEDNDWSYRALHLGVPIYYAPDVVVQHLDWRTEVQLISTFRAYAYSQGGFFGKHLRCGDWFILLRVMISQMRAILRWVRGVVSRNRMQSANGWAFMTRVVPGIIAGWRGSRSHKEIVVEKAV